MSATNYFNKNKYVLLTEVFTKEKCAELCKYIFSLYERGKLVKDPQCPLSDSVYGDPILDDLLQKLAKPLGDFLKVPLLPTYSYCRIYRKGETLKKHKDRPSCEISGTMTLGISPESQCVWPIFVSEDEEDLKGSQIEIEPGNLLVYKGQELTHWRPELLAEWQIQVFFHYVDAQGPNKDLLFDNRPKLGVEATKKVNNNNSLSIFNGVMIPSQDEECPGAFSYTEKFKPELTFSAEECQRIIDTSKGIYPQLATVGTEYKNKVDLSIRNVQEYLIPLKEDTKWIFDKISKIISVANEEHFQYEIMGITHGLQLLHYTSGDVNSHYDWHIDMGPGKSTTRKISVSVQLSVPEAYEGGELLVNNLGVIASMNKDQGSVSMFPSYFLHRVNPITRGDRWALVIWVHGSQRFK